MSLALIAGIVAAVFGIAMLLVMESKVAGVIASGIGAFFLALSFYGDMSANTAANSNEIKAQSADFARDFESTNCLISSQCDRARLKQLADRADKARAEADEAEAKRKEVLAASERTRKPLMDALTHEVERASSTPTPSSDPDVGMGN